MLSFHMGEQWSDFGHTLKLESTEFAHGLDMKCEIKGPQVTPGCLV